MKYNYMVAGKLKQENLASFYMCTRFRGPCSFLLFLSSLVERCNQTKGI